MHILKRRIGIITGIAAVLWVVACSGSSGTAPNISASSFALLSGQLPIQPTELAGSTGTPINAPAYVAEVVQSNEYVWKAYLHDRQLSTPLVSSDALSMGDSIVSACHDGAITHATQVMVYCGQDTDGTAWVYIPMGLVASLWTEWASLDRQTGDLAVAIAVSRQVDNIVVKSLAEELSLPAPRGVDFLYLAACLSGAWAHAVFPARTFSSNQLQAALARDARINFELNHAVVTTNATTLSTAWMSGYTTGEPGSCSRAYWKP